tara:strand:- start:193 stop:423 length:231 start_codon:yes stop_codon:yes gene_type:complete
MANNRGFKDLINGTIDKRFDNPGIPYSGKLVREKQQPEKKYSLEEKQNPLTKEERLKRNQEQLSKDPTARFGIIKV